MLYHHLLSHSASKYPQHIALIDRHQQINYEQLWQQSQQLAAFLRQQGINRGDRIAIYLDKRIESIVCFFAASCCGAVFVPINPKLKWQQFEHIIHDCEPKVLISKHTQLQYLGKMPGELLLVSLDSTELSNDYFLWQSLMQTSWGNCDQTDDIQEDDLAALLYTSGSSGLARGVMISHRNLVQGAEIVSCYLQYQQTDRILAILPLSFDYGLNQISSAFFCAATVVLMDFLLAKSVLDMIAKYQISILAGVPTFWIQLSACLEHTQQVASLRLITNSGGSLPQRTIRQYQQYWPHVQIYLMYGLTEAFRSSYLPPQYLRKYSSSIGKAIPKVTLLVVNREKKTLCDPWEQGELIHLGALISKGYWQNPQASKKVFQPLSSILQKQQVMALIENKKIHADPDQIAVCSGDWVYFDEQGWLYFVERKSEMIKSSGYRISPNEIEQCLYQYPEISQACVIGVADDLLGQKIIAFVSFGKSDQKQQYKGEQILFYLKKQLPAYAVPAQIMVLPQLPLGANHKIDRQALKQYYENLLAQE